MLSDIESDAGDDLTDEETSSEPPHIQQQLRLKSVPLSAPLPPTMRTLFKVLKTRGVRYTKCTKETRCSLHDNGEVWKISLQAARMRLSEVRNKNPADVRCVDLASLIHNLQRKVALYEVHMEQYKTQRVYVKELECNLPPGHAIVYRDFVNMYVL